MPGRIFGFRRDVDHGRHKPGWGPAWLLRRLSASLAPQAPFHDELGRKGLWGPLTAAPPHRCVQYTVERAGVTAPWRIALVADLHAGSYNRDIARLSRIMAQVDDLAPDLVLLLGDYTNMMGFGGGRVPPHATARLLQFPKARHGVFAVLGNHDWEYGYDSVREALEGQGIRVLENEWVAIPALPSGHDASTDRPPLIIAGLSDDRMGKPDPAILNTIPPYAPTLIMAHDPAVFFDVPEGALMVCGHMHGGQIRIPPFLPPLVPAGRAPRRWAGGHVRERGGDLIVSAGLGCSGLPIRFFAPPEIVILNLKPPASGG
jgi:uncharacterized protein